MAKAAESEALRHIAGYARECKEILYRIISLFHYNMGKNMGKGNTNRRDFMKYSLAAVAGLATPGCFSEQSIHHYDDSIRHNYRDKCFLEYPEELGKLCDRYWEEGKPVEYTSTLVRQLFAITNDIIELPAEFFADVADNVGYKYLLGVKARGKKNKRIARNAVKYAFDLIPGSMGNDRIVDLILRGDVDGAFEYARKVEDTELGANMKIGAVIFSNYLQIDTALKAAFGGENFILRKDGGGAAAPATFTPGPAPAPPMGP